MIEFGVFCNQGTDLAPVETDQNVMVPGGDLEAIHAGAQRAQESMVRQGILADRVGFNYWFQTEHHFQVEGAEMSPNPLITQATLAGLTKQIRLCQIANVVTQHNPIRLAEMAAMVDVLSGGRLEMGIARGYQPREVETLGWPFGTVQDQEKNRALYEEVIEIIVKAWTEPSMSHHGQHYTLPPRHTKWNHAQSIAQYSQDGLGAHVDDVFNIGPPDMYAAGSPVVATTTTLNEISVLPQPLQKPHPQMWEPLTSSRSIEWAARHGVNGYFLAEPNALLKDRVDTYMKAAEEAGWPDLHDRGEFKRGWDSERKRGCVASRVVHVIDDGIGDEDKIRAAAQVSWDFYGSFGFNFLLADEAGNIPARASFELLCEKGLYIVGTKQEVIDQILEVKEIGGFDDFCFCGWFEQPGLTDQEEFDQMSYFMREIAPALAERCGGQKQNEVLGLDFTDHLQPVPA